MADDSRMRWLRPGEVPTLGNWFRAAGYDTHYDGKWHLSHADLHDADGEALPTNTADGDVLAGNVARYLDADPLAPFGFSGWVGPEPHGGLFGNSGLVRDPLIAERVVAWLTDRYDRRRAGDEAALRPFLLVASFVNPHDIVLFPLWMRRGLPDRLDGIEVPPVPFSPTDFEDLCTKPAAQVAYRAAYPSCYGPPGPGRVALPRAPPALPRPVPPAPRHRRRAPRPCATCRHRRHHRRSTHRADIRPRRAARRPRRPAPEVVPALRRGHPGALRRRPSRCLGRTHRRGPPCRVADVARRSRPHVAGRGRHRRGRRRRRTARRLHRGASAAGPEPAAHRRRRRRPRHTTTSPGAPST